MNHKWTVHLGCFFLLLSLELPALCESRIKCPDGEMRIQMNVQDIAITYDGYSLSVAWGKGREVLRLRAARFASQRSARMTGLGG